MSGVESCSFQGHASLFMASELQETCKVSMVVKMRVGRWLSLSHRVVRRHHRQRAENQQCSLHRPKMKLSQFGGRKRHPNVKNKSFLPSFSLQFFLVRQLQSFHKQAGLTSMFIWSANDALSEPPIHLYVMLDKMINCRVWNEYNQRGHGQCRESACTLQICSSAHVGKIAPCCVWLVFRFRVCVFCSKRFTYI